MRRLLIVLGVVALCSAPTWADSIELDVNAWATFTAPASTCFSNCTETAYVSFLYTPADSQNGYEGQITSLTESFSGELGSFSSGNNYGYYMPFFNAGGDEIDLHLLGFTVQPGIDTVGWYMPICESQACAKAYGQSWDLQDYPAGVPTNEGSIAIPVAVSDGDSTYLIAALSLGAMGLAWRWHKHSF